MGASIWGDGRPLNISLDRADLWDLRPIEEYERADYTWEKVAEAHYAGRHDDLKAWLEAPYDRAGPTRLPAGRIALILPCPVIRWRLERATGRAEVELANGAVLESILDAEGICRLRLRGCAPVVSVVPPPFGPPPTETVPETGPSLSRHHAWDLGYPVPEPITGPGMAGFVQQGWGGFSFATLAAWRLEGADWMGACTVVTAAAGGDPLGEITRRLEAALAGDFDQAVSDQAAWWSDYWSRGRLDLPEASIEKVYYSGMSQFGAAARRGRPPAALQGVWTSDDGRLPPWKGDYHHDINSQMAYWPAYAGNQLEAGLGFLDWLWDTREACTAWTRRFYGVQGLNVPMTADLLNRQIGGWRQYTHSVSTGAWLAHHFFLHWRYSQDRQFLRERALPYLTEVCRFVEAITEVRDAQGLRSVALSSSPEVGDNRPEAWFSTFTNYDLSLFRWVLAATATLAREIGRAADAEHWESVVQQMPELNLSARGELQVAQDVEYPGHHRHFSHALAVHPLALLTGFDPDPVASGIARATVGQILSASREFWMGYSYAWAAALAARISDGEAARDALARFDQAFVFPNGFHANGDWSGRGIGRVRFGAFTLEGALGAADAIQTMLLQSSPGLVRLFPAVPRSWETASFDTLLADGAIEVSASLAEGRITRVELLSSSPAQLRLAAFDQPARLDLRLEPGRLLVLSEAERIQLARPLLAAEDVKNIS